ncbi:MAG: FAD-binding protein, partial [Alphaproteobacteria bacterium]
GNRMERDMIDEFLEFGPRMVAFLEEKTSDRFVTFKTYPDYHPDTEGAAMGGRLLRGANYDGRLLGKHFAELRPSLDELSIFGGMMIAGEDVPHLFNMTRSFRSARYVAKLLARHAIDRLRYPRGTRLANGNALAARLGKSVFDLGIPMWLAAPARELIFEGGGVRGAVIERSGGAVRVRARNGVVLAAGGFPRSDALRKRLMPHVAKGIPHWTLVPGASDGDGLHLGEAAGAELRADGEYPAVWMPASRVPKPDGTHVTFPHLIDRAKPGFIAVDRSGKRFVNESASYQDFVPAMLPLLERKDNAIFLVCDHRAIRKYGIGAVRPFPGRLGRHLKSGYLLSGATPQDLAKRAGIDAAAFADTIERFNIGAESGADPEFGKGGNAYNRFMGDANHTPNPCVAPLADAPFYAVRLFPGDVGTFAGLRTDAAARVLDANRQPIPGLYAAGADMASIMGGLYPAGGVTLGPALTFGYIAGLHLAGQHLTGHQGVAPVDRGRAAG